ncbi:tenomodulin [Spea bombifrons]|uniref:tenomodulin n=1 Tax=Spea bombifrons TaxID=233779 RepID=UPI00234A8B85|nr:tenomodulin [Spea bombifrons]
MKTEHILNEGSPHDAEASKPKKGNFKRCTILAIAVCFFMLTLLLVLLFSVKNVWFHLPEKRVYDVEYKFFSNGEKTTVRMEIDPRNKIETFLTENGTDEAVEIHDFKNGITGIFFTGLQKCFIKTQIKEIPDNADAELVELEEGEISTVYEESMVWIPGEKPIDDTEFMKNSKILEVCKDVSIHWMYPTPLTAPEFQGFEDGKEDGVILEKKSNSNKRQARDLTDEDLPINDYSEAGLEFHSMWDHRGFCCHQCRRGQRYCQRVCEPLLGFYPYPYCYGSGRVICRIIMPCNWWIARMLGRV